ncbi:MAG TPA: transketolase C-terminal domain-containing protein [Candidatus Limnocylindria bacterium]|nr:transketolase C-terminal domain-containing protein [Candidatus Limnocylindria bacterium]
MIEPSMRAQMASTITELMDDDPRLVMVLCDISVGLFEAAARAHPGRVLSIGIMEQTAVSLAAGLALEGLVPVVHSIAPFIVERPFEQIKDDFCYQRLGGNFVSIGASYDYASDGMTHQAPGDVPILSTLPGMEVVVPGTPAEFDALFREAYADGAPTYFRTSAQANRDSRPVRFGRLDVVRTGTEATVVAVGPMLDRVIKACTGHDVSIAYCTTVRPFDAVGLRSLVGARRAPVLLVEPYYAGTGISDVVTALAPMAVRVEAIGVPRRVLSNYGTADEHDAALGLTAPGIRARLESLLAEPRA